MPAPQLTDLQRRLWQALTRDDRQSLRELAETTGASSTSVVAYNLRRLAKHEIVELRPIQARSVRLLKRYEEPA